MYTETQNYQNRTTRWLQWVSAAVAVGQLALLIAAETGRPWMPLGWAAHFVILLVSTWMFGWLWDSGLVLRIGSSGISIRFRPYQWQFQQASWEEVRRIRLISKTELPTGASFGSPAHDFTHTYWLTKPGLGILCIELVNGHQLFVTTQRPDALMNYLKDKAMMIGKYRLNIEQ